jgi:Spy/CpxP family protein refolding chaperone
MSDMTTPPAAPARPPRRWLGPALLASLIVNLFLIGLVTTAILHHRDGPHTRGHHSHSIFGLMRGDTSSLSKDDRAAMRKIMVGQFKTIRPQLVAMDEARKKLAAAVGATPYDPAKVSAAFAEIEAAQTAMGRTMRDAMIKGFGEMSDEQRQNISAAMLKKSSRHHWRRQKDSEMSPPDAPDGP